MESTDTTSPSKRLASATPIFVLPDAVGPTTQITPLCHSRLTSCGVKAVHARLNIFSTSYFRSFTATGLPWGQYRMSPALHLVAPAPAAPRCR